MLSKVKNEDVTAETLLEERIIGKINSLINSMESKKAVGSNDKDEDENIININNDK